MSIDARPPQTPGRSLAARLRSWFFTGLVIFGPVALTLYVAWWAIDTVDGWVKAFAPAHWWPDTYLPFHVPGFGVVIAAVGLTLLGFLAANFAGRTLVALGEAMLDRTPIVRSLYKSLKQIFETMFSQSGEQFRRVGLVEFPTKGTYSIVFLSSDPPADLAARMPGKPMTSVFMPCWCYFQDSSQQKVCLRPSRLLVLTLEVIQILIRYSPPRAYPFPVDCRPLT